MDVIAVIAAASLVAVAATAFFIHPTAVLVATSRICLAVFLLGWMDLMLFYPSVGRAINTMPLAAGALLAPGNDWYAAAALFTYLTIDCSFMLERSEMWMNHISAIVSACGFFCLFAYVLARPQVKTPWTVPDVFACFLLVAFAVLDGLALETNAFMLAAAFCFARNTEGRPRGAMTFIGVGFLVVASVVAALETVVSTAASVPLLVASAAIFIHEKQEMDVRETAIFVVVAVWVAVVSLMAYSSSPTAALVVAFLVVIAVVAAHTVITASG